MRTQMIVFILMLLIPGTVLSAPEMPETINKTPGILFLPITDNTGMKNIDYISEAITALYAKKYPAEKFAIIPLENYTSLVATNNKAATEDEMLKAAATINADYVVRTDLQTIKIRRGFKGILIKKWCAAEIPINITIWSVATGKTVFDSLVQARGDKANIFGGTAGLLLTVSEKSAVENGLKKLGEKLDKGLPALQQ